MLPLVLSVLLAADPSLLPPPVRLVSAKKISDWGGRAINPGEEGLLFHHEPLLFWRGAQACVRSSPRANQMRCFALETQRWSKVEAYRSPFEGGARVEFGKATAHGKQDVTTVAPDGTRTGVASVYEPQLLARTKEGGVLAFSMQENSVHGNLTPADARLGPGSAFLFDGSFYFRPRGLWALVVVPTTPLGETPPDPGPEWSLAPNGLGRSDSFCTHTALVAPNGHSAVCIARSQSTGALTVWLMEFERV